MARGEQAGILVSVHRVNGDLQTAGKGRQSSRPSGALGTTPCRARFRKHIGQKVASRHLGDHVGFLEALPNA